MACEGGPHGAHPGHARDPGRAERGASPASRNGRSAARGSAGTVLDHLSKQIIEQLQEDGRRSYAAIGKAVGLSEAAVRQRVQRLVDAGIMQIVAVTDPLMLGFRRQTMIGIKCGGDLEQVADQLAAMEEIDYVVITAGSFDLLVEVVCEDDGHLLEILSRVRGRAQRDQHRDVRVPEAAQADLRLGDQMTTPHDLDLQEAARRHLWLHFTRMSSYADGDVPVIVRGSGQYVFDQNGKRYLDGLSGLFVSQVGHGRKEVAEAGAQQASELAYFPLWSYAHPRAIELAERLADLAPGDLNRVFFTTSGSEAVESAWKLAKQYFKADRRARPVQGAQPGHRLPRHVDGRAGHHRAARDQGAVRAAAAGRGPGAEHQLLPGARLRGRRPRRRSAGGRPTRSSGPSCARARSRWPRCSWSRCRTRAAASRRRPATSPGSARSATATACSSSRTRSSARSAGSATTSARSGTSTSRTSSPSPRA